MKVSDPKYVSLRRKLDDLNYTQTLHCDSVELVDHILRDYFKIMTQFEKEKKRKPETNDRPLQQKLATLTDQVEFLSQRNDQLQKEVEGLKRGGGLEEKIARLNGSLQDYRVKYDQKVKEFGEQILGLEEKVEELKTRNGELERQNLELKNRGSLKSEELERMNAELSGLLERRGKELRELEQNNSRLRVKIGVLERRAQQAEQSLRSARESAKSENGGVTELLKQELLEAEKRIQSGRLILQESHEQRQVLRREIRRLRQQLSIARSQQNRNRNLEGVSKLGREKVEGVLEQTREALAGKMQELRQLKQRQGEDQREIERLNGKIRELMGRNKHLGEQGSDLQAQIQMVSGKLTTQVKRVRELQAANTVLERQIKEQHSREAEWKQQEKEAIPKQGQQGLRREVAVLTRQVKISRDEVAGLREEGLRGAVERERLGVQLRRLQAIISEGSKNLEVAQGQKEELMRELRELRAGRQQSAGGQQALKNELLILREKAQGNQLLVDELKGMLRSGQLANKQLEGEVARLLAAVGQAEERGREAFEDNKMMAGQIRLLENRKLELTEKIRNLQDEVGAREGKGGEWRKEAEDLSRRCEELQVALAQKDRAVLLIDGERDELQNELDRKTEENASLKQKIKGVERDWAQQSRGTGEREANLQALQRRLTATENEKVHLEHELNRLGQVLSQAQERVNRLSAQKLDYQNQVKLLVLSSQESQRQTERNRGRTAELQRRLKERTREYDEERERASGSCIQNQQLCRMLEEERVESTRLRGFIEEYQKQNNSMFYHLENRDRQLKELRELLDQAERREGQFMKQIQGYQREMEHLTRDLADAQDELGRVAGERGALRAESRWRHQNSQGSLDRRVFQQQKLLQVQQECELRRRETEQMRGRVRELQSILGQQRTKNFQLERRIQSLRGESKVRLDESSKSENWNSSNVHSRLLLDESGASQGGSLSSGEIREKLRRYEQQYVKIQQQQMDKFTKRKQ